MSSIGEALVDHLKVHDVEVVFGIPGVHTVELYRGLEDSGIRHVTPRHEQGAGFMADGYARVTGKPGVALVITGPGVTNILTPMAQAREDSIPMLVISSVNPLPTLGKGLGHLHELPDQLATVASVATRSIQIRHAGDLEPAMNKLFTGFSELRPGPAHIEIPIDVAELESETAPSSKASPVVPQEKQAELEKAVELLSSARNPVILSGGGMRRHNDALQNLAECLKAPVVLTVNGRGLMHGHDLSVPASPSLQSVRDLISSADVILALGTELGQTDFDMYATGSMPQMRNLIRVDISSEQLSRHEATVNILAEAGEFSARLFEALSGNVIAANHGSEAAAQTRNAAFQEIGGDMQSMVSVIETMRDTIPNSIIVGDSTQPIYAGNLYYDHDRPGGWFNAATGYGALGYGIPSAIGAAIGAPDARVICLTGDGGAQFSLPEIMAAVDEALPIIFVVWNNNGYREIETSMESAGVKVVGCDPTPPNFELVAASCGIPYYRSDLGENSVGANLKKALAEDKPVLLEINAL